MEIFQLFLQEQAQKPEENQNLSTKFFDASFLVLHNAPISIFLPQTITFFGTIVATEQQKGLTAPENFCFHLGQVIIKMLNRYPLIQSVSIWISRLLEFILQHKGLTFVATMSMEAIPSSRNFIIRLTNSYSTIPCCNETRILFPIHRRRLFYIAGSNVIRIPKNRSFITLLL
jgi:hypothetical protein